MHHQWFSVTKINAKLYAIEQSQYKKYSIETFILLRKDQSASRVKQFYHTIKIRFLLAIAKLSVAYLIRYIIVQ